MAYDVPFNGLRSYIHLDAWMHTVPQFLYDPDMLPGLANPCSLGKTHLILICQSNSVDVCDRGGGDINCQKNIAAHLIVIILHRVADQKAGNNTVASTLSDQKAGNNTVASTLSSSHGCSGYACQTLYNMIRLT